MANQRTVKVVYITTALGHCNSRVSSRILSRGSKHSSCHIKGGEDYIVVFLAFRMKAVMRGNVIVQQ